MSTNSDAVVEDFEIDTRVRLRLAGPAEPLVHSYVNHCWRCGAPDLAIMRGPKNTFFVVLHKQPEPHNDRRCSLSESDIDIGLLIQAN